MTKAERNEKIIKKVDVRVQELGYGGKLEMDPITNTFKRRNHFTTKADGTGVFTAFMWQMNSLSDDDLLTDIDSRVNEAATHFKLKQEELYDAEGYCTLSYLGHDSFTRL